MGGTATFEDFHLSRGGPFHRLFGTGARATLPRRARLAVLLTWLPMVALGAGDRLWTGHWETILVDWSVHVRLVISLPLFLAAERILDLHCQDAIARLYAEDYIRADRIDRFDALLRRAEQQRDARAPEWILASACLAIGVAALFGGLSPIGLMHGVETGDDLHLVSEVSPARVWYTLVGLPTFQFLLWRSLFRWSIWIRMLVGLSRLDLQLVATHPDRRGGLSFLRLPSVTYCAVLLFALSSVMCSTWVTQVAAYGVKLAHFKPLIFIFIFVGTSIAFGPLLLFTPCLMQLRLTGLRRYGALATRCSRRFQHRWLGSRAGDAALLEENDACALTDLNSTYRESVDRVGIILVGPRDFVLLLAATVIPAIPVVLTKIPPAALLEKLGAMLLGMKSG